MRKKLKWVTITFGLVALALGSCRQDEKIAFTDADEVQVELFNDSILAVDADTVFNPIQGAAAPGDAWESWDDAFFSCFANESFKKKNRVYLGPSNLKYLGTILSRNKQLPRWELDKIIPAADMKKFVSEGAPVNTCDLTKVKNLSLDVLLKVAYKKMDDSLRVVLTNYDSIKITGGEWQIDHINTGPFESYLNSSTDQMVKDYKKSLTEDGNLLIVQVVKVNGFKADIYSERGLSAGLKVKLETPQTIDLTQKPTDPPMSLEIGLDKEKKKAVSLSSNTSFYIFAMVVKGKKV